MPVLVIDQLSSKTPQNKSTHCAQASHHEAQHKRPARLGQTWRTPRPFGSICFSKMRPCKNSISPMSTLTKASISLQARSCNHLQWGGVYQRPVEKASVLRHAPHIPTCMRDLRHSMNTSASRNRLGDRQRLCQSRHRNMLFFRTLCNTSVDG